MTYLQRIDYRPSEADLTEWEQEQLARYVELYGSEIVIYGEPVRWDHIEEVEIALAPRAIGFGGWFVKRFMLNNKDRYHIGLYFGSREAVMPNITLNLARHIAEMVAYYAPQSVRYTGPEDIVLLSEI